MVFEYVAADLDHTPRAPVDIEELDDTDLVYKILRDSQLQKATFSRGSLGWVRLGHVCRQWREVLYGMQALWGQILGRLPLGDEDILARAGDHALIDVFSCHSPFHIHERKILELLAFPRPQTPVRPYLLPYANRLRRVSLINLTTEKRHIPLDWLNTSSFPTLDTLEMSFPYPHGTAPFLPPRRLEAPRLRVLRLQSCFIPWHSFALERLALHWIDNDVLSTRALLHMLEQASATLQHLELFCAFDPNDMLGSQRSGQLILPRLRRLYFSAKTGDFRVFLRFVKLPPGVQLRVHFYQEVNHDWLETDDEVEVEDRRTFQSDIEAALLGGCFDASLDGLVISQADPDEVYNELHFYMYPRSLDVIRSLSQTIGSDPFDVDDASFTLTTQNGRTGPEADESLTVCCTAMAQYLNSERFTTISIDTPLWNADQISSCMSLFPKMRALRVFDPLWYGDIRYPLVPQHELPTTFPFHSQYVQTEQACNDDHPHTSAPVLDVLWLVEQQSTLR